MERQRGHSLELVEAALRYSKVGRGGESCDQMDDGEADGEMEWNERRVLAVGNLAGKEMTECAVQQRECLAI